MSKVTEFLSSAWTVTKRVAVPVLRGVAVLFAGRKVGAIADEAAVVADAVIKASEKDKG